VSLLTAFLEQDPSKRPTIAAAGEDVFFHPWRLRQLDPFEGHRSTCRIYFGALEPSILQDCQREICEKATLLSCGHLIDPEEDKAPQTHFEEYLKDGGHPTKSVVSGKLAANASSKSMCAQPVDQFVPLDTLVAFFDALRIANSDDLGVLRADIVKLIRTIPAEERLENGAHAMQTPIENWFAAVTQLQTKIRDFFDKPEQNPPIHYDGAPSVVHASVTFFDHRLVKLWTEDPLQDKEAKKLYWPGVEPTPACVIPNVPGTFYIGNLTAAAHQVVHCPSAPTHDSLDFDGKLFGVTAQCRTTLFPNGPHARSRCCRGMPVVVWQALTQAVLAWVARGNFRLPTYAEFAAALARHRLRSLAAEPKSPSGLAASGEAS
jgi:hypothetical protein